MGIITKFKQFRSSNGNGKGNGQESTENPKKAGDKEMSFLEHLEELRWHLVRSVAALFIFAIFFFIQRTWFIDDIILGPTKGDFPFFVLLCKLSVCLDPPNITLQAIKVPELFLSAINISIIGGIILAFPYILWEAWRFIKPGLTPKERRGMRGGIFIMSMLFFLGVAFAYYVITPISIQFLSTFSLTDTVAIENNWRIGSIISFVAQLALVGGLFFQLPIISYFLAKIGLLGPQFLIKYRRHAFVVLLVLSALITPPDIYSQVLIFIPLLVLYQISIRVVKRVVRKQQQAEAASATEV